MIIFGDEALLVELGVLLEPGEQGVVAFFPGQFGVDAVKGLAAQIVPELLYGAEYIFKINVECRAGYAAEAENVVHVDFVRISGTKKLFGVLMERVS